jgi:hypothetical protein
LQTVPGKGWNTIFRINGTLEPWFDKPWKPVEIEPVIHLRCSRQLSGHRQNPLAHRP